MKRFVKRTLITLACLCFCVCPMLLSGCTYKTYKLVGLVDVASDKVVYYENLNDDQKQVIDAYHSYTIKLRENGKYEIKYSTYAKPKLTTISITGKFTLEDNVLTFTLENDKGESYSLKQQFTNGRIIFYDDESQEYFVFE